MEFKSMLAIRTYSPGRNTRLGAPDLSEGLRIHAPEFQIRILIVLLPKPEFNRWLSGDQSIRCGDRSVRPGELLTFDSFMVPIQA